MTTRKAIDGRMIIGPINDSRLKPGIKRTRSGMIQQFGERVVCGGKLIQECDFTITPPAQHYCAEEINGVWMWVNDCARCNQNGIKWSYISCIDHDRCQHCDTKRSEATTMPDGGVWGHIDADGYSGWICHSCNEREQQAIRDAALARIPPTEDFDETDYWHEDEAKCPWCNAKIHTDESYGADGQKYTCDECGHLFTLTAEHSVSWTTKRLGG